jgi:hypothetical protein
MPIRSAAQSGKCGPERSGLRTTSEGRPPRHCWHFGVMVASLWQPITRPPHGRSGNRLPVEAEVPISLVAGRAALSQVVWCRA